MWPRQHPNDELKEEQFRREWGFLVRETRSQLLSRGQVTLDIILQGCLTRARERLRSELMRLLQSIPYAHFLPNQEGSGAMALDSASLRNPQVFCRALTEFAGSIYTRPGVVEHFKHHPSWSKHVQDTREHIRTKDQSTVDRLSILRGSTGEFVLRRVVEEFLVRFGRNQEVPVRAWSNQRSAVDFPGSYRLEPTSVYNYELWRGLNQEAEFDMVVAACQPAQQLYFLDVTLDSSKKRRDLKFQRFRDTLVKARHRNSAVPLADKIHIFFHPRCFDPAPSPLRKDGVHVIKMGMLHAVEALMRQVGSHPVTNHLASSL